MSDLKPLIETPWRSYRGSRNKSEILIVLISATLAIGAVLVQDTFHLYSSAPDQSQFVEYTLYNGD